MSTPEDPQKAAAQAEIDALTAGIDDGAEAEASTALTERGFGYETTEEERTRAMLAHLSTIVGAILVPAILIALKGEESPFVKYHAMQALIFQVANLVFVLTIGLAVIFCTFGLGFPIVFLGWIPAILWGLKANRGEWVGYPGIEQIGR